MTAARLLVHGGAGRSSAAARGEAGAAAARAALVEALRQGQAQLVRGGSALDAVCAAVAVLEDAPAFNAGRGAVLAHDGRIELDAAVMSGHDRRAGAVAGLRRVRHPVWLARAVMEHTPHVLLAGDGAEDFARGRGLELMDPEWFYTEERRQQWRAAQQREAAGASARPAGHGTVGAVALDVHGHLAAATSTGGLCNKRWGRVSDSALIGAGTYADARCAVSGTGAGEFYIRSVAAHAICSRVAAGERLEDAAAAVINVEIPGLGGEGGALVLGADGRWALPFNTPLMFRGVIEADGPPRVATGREALA